MYKVYSSNCLGLEMYEICKKNGYGLEVIGLYRNTCLKFKIISKIKLRVLNFGHMMAVHMTIMYINFQTNL